MITRRNKRKAFTLVEVMLAIAILSVVIAAIYGTWRAIIGATRAGQITADEVQRRRVALREIEQVVTYAQMFAAAKPEDYSFDYEDGLSFVSRLPSDFLRSGRFNTPVRRVQFKLVSGQDGGQDLVMRQRPVLSEDYDLDEQEHPVVLMHHVKKLDKEYWDAQKEDWVDTWDQANTNQIPKLVRITVSTEDPRNSFGRGQDFVLEIAPICYGVPAGLQGRAPGQQAGRQGGLGLPPK